jgi:uncharacterized membrane protein
MARDETPLGAPANTTLREADRRDAERRDEPDRRDSDRRDSDRRESERGGRRQNRTPRLDQPKETRRVVVPRPHYDPDAFGNFAETFARFMGTARFLMYMSGFVVVWIALNLIGTYGLRWDPYPFILLNLFFSTQASYAAPLILLAQNRQEARDRVITEGDREADARAHADMDFLAREVASLRMAIGEVATRDYLRSELRGLLAEIESRRASDEATDARSDGRAGDDGPGERRPGTP